MEKRWWKESVVYQIYPRSFCDSNGDGIGDLNGITGKLDYLKELGIDVIWLSPVYKSPNDDNGYDISDYQAIMDEFGTMEDFDRMLATAHEKGIKIMMDLVVNHTSDEHKWFIESRKSTDNPYRDYYIWRPAKEDGSLPNNWGSCFSGPAWEYDKTTDMYFLHLFSKKQPDLNWDNPAVRQDVFDMMNWWLKKGVDGFRMDVISLISKEPGLPDKETGINGYATFNVSANGPHVHEYLKELTRDTGIEDMITVGEMSSTSLENCIRYSGRKEKELSMCFNFHHLKVDYKDGDKWTLMEPDRIALKKLFETWQMGMQDGDGWNALFWCNHDQPRVVSRMGNEDLYWKESAKMLAAAIHMMRGTPYVYQGEELGMTNAHYNDISQYRDVESLNYYKILLDQGKTKEQALKVLAARSRDNSRTPMQWSDDKNAGFTEGTPWIEAPENYKEINAETELKDPDSIYSFYKKLIALRKEKDIIAEGTIEFLEKENADVLAYRRNYQGEELIVLNNLTAENVTIRQQPEWKAYQKRLGNYEKITAEDGKITLRPFETIVLDSAL